jgi:phage baseplate assembly protein W
MRRTVYVQAGDTILILALRHLGSSDRWRDLVTANSLTYPYVTADPTPWRAAGGHVLTTGDAMLVPALGPITPLTQEAAEAATYGVDLAWSASTLGILSEGTRIGLDRGVRNLQKALYRRLITRPGELPAHPAYGCNAAQHIGHPATTWRARLAALDVQAALERDPRVQSTSVTVEYMPTGELRATALVTPIPPSESFSLSVTIGGNRATADL